MKLVGKALAKCDFFAHRLFTSVLMLAHVAVRALEAPPDSTVRLFMQGRFSAEAPAASHFHPSLLPPVGLSYHL